MLKIIAAENIKDTGKNAADIVTEVIKNKPDAVLGLATGSSPIEMYRELVARCARGEISFKQVKSVNLDEYVGLAPDHDQSYAYFMHHNLFDSVDIDVANTNLPNGLASDPAAECKRYDAVVASMGGIDLQVLGIGLNGHIGFNEPSDAFTEGTGLVDLTQSTIDANSRFFENKSLVPTQAFSMGVGQIMSAKKILLIATGEAKAQILERALFGEITPRVPASVLRRADDVVVCADRAALSVILKNHPDSVEFQ